MIKTLKVKGGFIALDKDYMVAALQAMVANCKQGQANCKGATTKAVLAKRIRVLQFTIKQVKGFHYIPKRG